MTPPPPSQRNLFFLPAGKLFYQSVNFSCGVSKFVNTHPAQVSSKCCQALQLKAPKAILPVTDWLTPVQSSFLTWATNFRTYYTVV